MGCGHFLQKNATISGKCLVRQSPSLGDLPARILPHFTVESARPEGADEMKPSRFSESQIIGMIKEQEAGPPVSDLCRKHGLSPSAFYKLKAKYGGKDLSDAKRLKRLEDENGKLKRLLVEAMLDSHARHVPVFVNLTNTIR